MEQRLLAKLDSLRSANQLVDKVHDPSTLRRELGITDEQLERLRPQERARLGEELKGRLAGYGMLADQIPNLVRFLLQTGG
jgi:Fe-S oxidoreductase